MNKLYFVYDNDENNNNINNNTDEFVSRRCRRKQNLSLSIRRIQSEFLSSTKRRRRRRECTTITKLLSTINSSSNLMFLLLLLCMIISTTTAFLFIIPPAPQLSKNYNNYQRHCTTRRIINNNYCDVTTAKTTNNLYAVTQQQQEQERISSSSTLVLERDEKEENSVTTDDDETNEKSLQDDDEAASLVKRRATQSLLTRTRSSKRSSRTKETGKLHQALQRKAAITNRKKQQQKSSKKNLDKRTFFSELEKTKLAEIALAPLTKNKKNDRLLVSTSTIEDTIDNFMKNSTLSMPSKRATADSAGVDTCNVLPPEASSSMPSFGILGDTMYEKKERLAWRHPNLMEPSPSTTLLSSYSKDNKRNPTTFRRLRSIRIRTASIPKDDYDIANLRLSVFSNFSAHLRQQFCRRSQEVLVDRRRRGAVCLVATTPVRKAIGKHHFETQNELVGSVECSVHEFYESELGYSRTKGSVLYVTEVAVHPKYRQCGIGKLLMRGIDELVTKHRTSIETVYLHVDVNNRAALNLYELAGYCRVNGDDMCTEFTKKLNLHDGATRGRNHFLLYKDIRESSSEKRRALAAKNKEKVVPKKPLRPKSSPIKKKQEQLIGFDIS